MAMSFICAVVGFEQESVLRMTLVNCVLILAEQVLLISLRKRLEANFVVKIAALHMKVYFPRHLRAITCKIIKMHLTATNKF